MRLSPVYDSAPMRAWSIHNTLSILPFEIAPDLSMKENIARLGQAFGVDYHKATALIDDTAHLTADYSQRVWGLSQVPESTREHLVGVVTQFKAKMNERSAQIEDPGQDEDSGLSPR